MAYRPLKIRVFRRSEGGDPLKFATEACFVKRAFPDGDFAQTKGGHGQIRLNTGKVQGFRKFDKVRYCGGEYLVKGKMSSGYAVLMDIRGKKQDFSHMPKGKKTPRFADMKRLSARKTCMTMEEAAMQSTG